MKTKLNIIIMSMYDRHTDIKPPTWKSSEPVEIFEKMEKCKETRKQAI